MNNKPTKELLKIITDFRKGILGNDKPNNKCYMVCSALYGFLIFLGYNSIKLVKGVVEQNGEKYEHYWFELPDKTIIDPTASQFKDENGNILPKVYYGDLPNYYTIEKIS